MDERERAIDLDLRRLRADRESLAYRHELAETLSLYGNWCVENKDVAAAAKYLGESFERYCEIIDLWRYAMTSDPESSKDEGVKGVFRPEEAFDRGMRTGTWAASCLTDIAEREAVLRKLLTVGREGIINRAPDVARTLGFAMRLCIAAFEREHRSDEAIALCREELRTLVSQLTLADPWHRAALEEVLSALLEDGKVDVRRPDRERIVEEVRELMRASGESATIGDATPPAPATS